MATQIQAAQRLTIPENMPRVTSLCSNFLSVEARPTYATFENDGPGYLSRKGPRHDNDHINFQDIQILPTTDEILAVHRTPYMPKKNVQEANCFQPGPQRLLDTLFRHLRFDSIEGIRDVCYNAAQHLAMQKDASSPDYVPQQETPSGNRYFLYRNVKFEELLSDEKRGVIVRVSYDCPQFMRGRAMTRSNRLEQGMLCCLVCLDDDGRSLSTVFFEVSMAQSTDSMKPRDGNGVRAAVQLAFAKPAMHDDVHRIFRHAQGLSSGQYVLVEFPKLLYAGFYHCLHTLQQTKSTDVAFSQYVATRHPASKKLAGDSVSQSTVVSPPAYCNAPGFRFNLTCLAQSDAIFSLSQLEQEAGQHLVRFLKQKTTLDDGQAVAFRDCLTREIAFTQGPPGTGKTYLGTALTRVLLASRPTANRKPILVVCLTNHALDSFLGGIHEAGITKIVRIGRASKEEWIKKFELHALTRNTKLTPDVWEAKKIATENAQTLFTELEAGCKGFNTAHDTGALSWPTVEAYLRSNSRDIYEQLTTSHDNPYAYSFAFDYWAGGGDLRNLQELRVELETCLLGSSANDRPSISTEGIDRALEQIALHAQEQSARAEKRNIWKLNLVERQRLICHWKFAIDRDALIESFSKLHSKHQSAGEAVRKSWHKRDAKCLLEQDVVGLTTTACASNWEMLKTLNLEIVICEEAGEVMEAHTLCSLFPSVQHAIFIGDPQQLRPSVSEQKMSLETAVGSQYRLDESLFERCMIPTDPCSKPMPTSQLNIQRRMHPDIADITRLVYPYLQDHPSTKLHPPTNGIAERMFWIDHRMPEADGGAASKSCSNAYEVAMVTGMVRYLIRGNAYSVGDIAILTPYNGQLAALHESLKATCSVWLSEKDRKALINDGLLEEPEEDNKTRSKDQLSMSNLLRIATVDNFQGEEAKIVILSTVRSGERPGFLKTMNRINVACSRARDGFYIVGNSNTLGRVPMWRRIINVFASRGRIGPGLRACCSRHPNHHSDIRVPRDFDTLQVCEIPCGETRPCGHSCQEPCHPPELHEKLPCMSQCNKIHPCGHQCLGLCSESCGPCRYPIEQKVLSCGHSVNLFCSGSLPICTEILETVSLPCGHQHQVRCCDRGKPYSCGEKCVQNLPCGHPCRGLCVDCHSSAAGTHRPCSSKCGMKLGACGHHCDSACHSGSPCPPCKQACQENCAHGKCKNLCSEACDPCIKPHQSRCSHQAQSSVPCSLPSDIVPCSERCDQSESFHMALKSSELTSLVLPCGHTCPSFCGEVCPREGCPQCVSGMVPTAPMLFCPTCSRALDSKDLDRKLISKIYTIDESGKIIGFASKVCEGSRDLKCACGESFQGIRRYSILKQINQAPAVIDRLLAKLGKTINAFSRRVYYHEKELEENFPAFRVQIRPNPLAANQNRIVVSTRAQQLLRLSDSINESIVSTATTIENALTCLQTTIPSALAKLTTHPIHPIFSLRLTILLRRAQNAWIADCLRVSNHLSTLADPSLEVHRMADLLRTRASQECWKGISDSEAAIVKAKAAQAPAIEVEIRLQQVQLSHLLEIALAAGGPEAKSSMPTMAPEPSSDSLKQAMKLCRHYPDTAGRFTALVNEYTSFAKQSRGMMEKKRADAPSSVPKTCSNETRRTELGWGEYVLGGLRVCARGGHLFSVGGKEGGGCPECGRFKEVLVEEVEVQRKAQACLFEDQFLRAMKMGK
jgi:AAA domain